jgi:hypothetical protein
MIFNQIRYFQNLANTPNFTGNQAEPSNLPKDKEQEGRRVTFEHRLPVQLMAIDGTWRRSCNLKDVSEDGATLQVEASIEGLSLREFFLLLSSTGLAYRRCKLDRVNGDELEVSFLHQRSNAKKTTKSPI